MLRISKLADYATLIMSQLAKQADKLSSASWLARNLRLSQPVVSKILKILCQAGLIASVRGAEGGYRLARSAHEITLADVLCAIEGDFAMTECCSQQSACALDASCVTKKNWQIINNTIYATLAKLTLNDMLHPLMKGPHHGK